MKRCKCKECKKLDYMNFGFLGSYFGTVVHCKKFPNGMDKPKFCKEFESEKGDKNDKVLRLSR